MRLPRLDPVFLSPSPVPDPEERRAIIELAEALGRLIGEHGYTQDSLATLLNRDRSTLANALRLLGFNGTSARDRIAR